MSGSGGHDELHAIRKWARTLTRDEILRAMEFTFLSDDDTAGGSHEYDLLKEMIELQSPPSTPIHPRCLFFKPATKIGVTDGRNEEDRVRKNRFRRPRLFQFNERYSTGVSWQNGTSGAKRRSGGGSRRRRQQLESSSKRFDVIARKFITPWGDVLSIGCTEDQQQADNAILRGTGIKHGHNIESKCCTFCGTTFQITDCFHRREKHGSTEVEQTSVLNMLRVASRGKFLSLPLSPNVMNGTNKNHESQNGTFCAPWLDPTAQWFSLPMYLASRYEIALWMTFRRSCGMVPPLPVPPPSCHDGLSAERLSRALQKSVILAFSTSILSDDAALTNVRDSIAWHLLGRPVHPWSSQTMLVDATKSLNITPLLELGTQTDHFRRLVQKHFQDTKAQEIQHDFVRSLSVEPKSGKCAESSTRKRRPKKKKRSKQRVVLPVVQEENNSTSNNSEVASADEDQSDDYLESIGKRAVSLTLLPPSKERNRNTIAVLALIDEVIEKVFDRVGLTIDDKKESEAQDVSPGDSPHLKGGKQEPEPFSPETTGDEQNHSRAAELIETRSSYSDLTGETDQSNLYHDPQVPTTATHGEHRPPFGLLSSELHYSQYGDHRHEPGFFSNTSPSDFALNINDPFDGWGRMNGYQSREKSIFTDFFLRPEAPHETQDEFLMASSTAASIASSSGLEDDDSEINDSVEEASTNGRTEVNLAPVLEGNPVREMPAFKEGETCVLHIEEESNPLVVPENVHLSCQSPELEAIASEGYSKDLPKAVLPPGSPMRSPSPPAPATPPPQLSPILVSLADLKTLRRRTTSGEWAADLGKEPTLVAGSLPSSPNVTSNGLTPSWSREDLRIASFADDQEIRRKGHNLAGRTDTVLSYRNAAAKSIARSASSGGSRKARDLNELAGMRPGIFVPDLPRNDGRRETNKQSYAQSETALEEQQEIRHLNDQPKVHHTDETDNMTTTKDGSTTISSVLSPHESEGLSSLREERNAFRDMCLTLGAEVAMLKNLLAVEKGSKYCFEYSQGYPQAVYGPSYNPEFVLPCFQGIPVGLTASRTVGAMSDAGIHRGDHESVNVSEDGTDVGCPHDNAGNPRAVHIRRMSSATIQGSDTSMDHTLSAPNDFRPLNREAFGSIPSHGLHSRLTKDIVNFLNSTSAQLRKQAGRRRLATERLSRLITALWPRAQVKLYGSHVSGTCLPSSDLDFVVCLPAVHKNAPAVAPGVLEGRNAINETSQKLLARKLKGESWIDPNSIKIVERTVVPVIKVSTKDTRARVVQLDISFDGPEHRGLDSIDIVKQKMQELPMIRPLILVLKQFLLDRGLLTAFTGGLSSYGLFLMIARYLQEQPSSWGDCGSLLMGFLDFYGNSFDPRTTGISVSRRQYFSRMNSATVPTYPAEQSMWNLGHGPNPGPAVESSPEFLLRRHGSFNEKCGTTNNAVIPAASAATLGMRPPRFQPPSSASPRRYKHQFSKNTEQSQNAPYDHVAKPYTFDPLFIEDPLSAGNNVGRNAFRVFQVQRAFSDAHRALVASLEWDIYSTADMNDGEYPLLKCLLQSEDVFYELEDPR